MELRPGAHVHLMGICGTAMASLAGIFKEMGYKVTGSDQNVYPPMSTQLEQLGIPVMEGYKKENLEPRPDLVIVGNVITRNHEEAQALLDSDIPYTSLPKAMGEFVIGHRQSIVVAGTHGKTTTTAMMASAAQACGIQAGFLIGGIPLNFSKSFRPPVDEWFIIEGDEYDTAFFDKVPKFVHYRPRHVIFTSLEFDHADIYNSLADIEAAFVRLMKLIPEDGTLIANADDPKVMEVIKESPCRNVWTYGEHQGDFRAVDRATLVGRNQFTVEKRGERVADVAIKHFGAHNTMNSLAVFAMAEALGWPRYQALQGLADFKGVKRRQELIGEPSGIPVIEDFAHHPTAVSLTIDAIRERYPQSRVIAVFEPRSATSRRRIFQKDYEAALKKADISYVAQAFDQSKISEDQRFSSQELIDNLKQAGAQAFLGEGSQQIADHIAAQARKGDVVLVMSNGGFDGIYKKLLTALGRV